MVIWGSLLGPHVGCRVKKRDRHKGDWRKALLGFAIFILAAIVGMMAGYVAEKWGGGW